MKQGILIIGTGQAALQLAGFLRDEGYAGSITMVGEEPHLPYQRPPLSKAYMNGDCDTEQLFFQPRRWFADRDIDIRNGVRIVHIDRERRLVETNEGESLPYERLVLATGARNRQIALPGISPSDICYLRGMDEAATLRDNLAWAERVVVIGGGFLGLEFAAIAASKGKRVVVIEAGLSLMGRAVCPEVGDAFRRHLETLGIRCVTGVTVDAATPLDGNRYRLTASNGQAMDADLVVASIGVIPNMELAAQAGLETGDGISVDEMLMTSDPNIAAIGDCASFRSRYALGAHRIESVQNAIDQPRAVARTLTGAPSAYDAVPWFWSDQGGLKLQIAGLSMGADRTVLRGDVEGGRFSAYRFRDGQLVAVESVGRPADHMTARRLLGAATSVTLAQVEDASCDLKQLLAA